MDVIYRPMHLSDVDRVWELMELLKLEQSGVSFVEIPSKDEIIQWLGNDHIFLYIAEDGERVLSVLRGIRGVDPSTRHAVKLTVATHPECRNKGIARELTNTGLEDMKKDGVSIARVYIYSDNYSSINTILRLGFTFAGSVHRHHFKESTQQYVDDLIFHKLL